MANANFTNRGLFRMLEALFQGAALPTNFYLAIVTNENVPTAGTNTFSELVEIADGNGYTAGGVLINRDVTDFPTILEDDGAALASVALKSIVLTATGGELPASGDPAHWVVLLNDDATPADREVWAFWSMGADRVVSDTQTITLSNGKLRLLQPTS